MELSRDKIKFYYDDELICGHVIGKFQKSDKYIFIVKNLRTGELEKRSLSLSLIENFD